jgi:hypothetical protein
LDIFGDLANPCKDKRFSECVMAWVRVADGTLRSLTDNDVGPYLDQLQPPRFFLTGDAHRNPPFEWTKSCSTMKLHFFNLVQRGALCAHVEQYPEDVVSTSLPTNLRYIYEFGKVFGWELRIFALLQPSMEFVNLITFDYREKAISNSRMDSKKAVQDIDQFIKLFDPANENLAEVGNPNCLKDIKAQLLLFRNYFKWVGWLGTPLNLATEYKFYQLLYNFGRDTMTLRTALNPYMAQNILQNIQKFPNDTHIITCGNNHILHNPLQNYLPLPNGAVGIVDAAAH